MITLPDNPDAPGCFGSALTFNPDASECRFCIFAIECEPLSTARRTALRAKHGIVDRPRTAKKSSVGASLDSELPKKVAALKATIDRAGIRVVEALAAGINPFERKPAFLRLTCHLLLRLPDGFNRTILRTALTSKLNWTEGTAAAHATQAFQVLGAFGVTEEIDGKLRLRRNLQP